MVRKTISFWKKCEYCGGDHKVYPYQVKMGEGKYCSQTCSNRANAKKLSENRKGKGNPMFGKKPWNYINGKSRTERNNAKYWNWRRKVFKRDKHTCRECNRKFKRKDLVAHHIKPWSTHTELRYTVNNGLTVCRPCHNIIDPLIKATQYKNEKN